MRILVPTLRWKQILNRQDNKCRVCKLGDLIWAGLHVKLQRIFTLESFLGSKRIEAVRRDGTNAQRRLNKMMSRAEKAHLCRVDGTCVKHSCQHFSVKSSGSINTRGIINVLWLPAWSFSSLLFAKALQRTQKRSQRSTKAKRKSTPHSGTWFP